MNFIESIKLKDGQFHLLDYHQARIDRTAKKHHFSVAHWRLLDCVSNTAIPSQGIFKVRISYGPDPLQIQVQPYKIRPVHSFRLLVDNEIDYSSKYSDRNRLTQLFEQRGSADDILIVKNNLLTDSYYANIALLKEGKWYTPKHPLLKGTKRQFYLDQGKLTSLDITPGDLPSFEQIALINAMIDLEDQVWIAPTNIQ